MSRRVIRPSRSGLKPDIRALGKASRWRKSWWGQAACVGLAAWCGMSMTASRSHAQDRFTGLQEINPPPQPDAARVVVIEHVTLVDGTGAAAVPDAMVVVRGDRIVGVGRRGEVAIPQDAQHVDGSGFTILPGLVDSHFHTATGRTILTLPELFLSHGVTAARDPGRPIEVYDPYRGTGKRAMRLFLTGPHYDQAPPAWPDNAIVIKDVEHARESVQLHVEQGGSAIKVYFRLPLAEIESTCETAHELGIPVTAHLELVDADKAIQAGLDGIEHITSFGTVLAPPELAEKFRDAVGADNEARKAGRYRLWATLNFDGSKHAAKLLKLLGERRVFVSPTLATFERRQGVKDAPEYEVEGFKKMMQFVGLCHDAGAIVVTGSHTWSQHVEMGWAFQREMELLVESGLTPMEVIQASTLNNARFLGCADRLGSIEQGKLADLVLVKGEPHNDITAMYDIQGVMLNGNWIVDPALSESVK